MPPFLQHRQANMRKMKVKSPEKETATTTREEDQESSLKGVPSGSKCELKAKLGLKNEADMTIAKRFATIPMAKAEKWGGGCGKYEDERKKSR